MYKKILVPVDDSETAKKALSESIILAREWQARLRIVHVIDPFLMNRNSVFIDMERIREGLIESGKKVLAEAIAKAKQAGASAESNLIELDKPTSSTADMIAMEAGAWPAELIIIGSHGRRGVQRLVMGSVAEAVVRIAPTPVLLIRGD